MTAVKWDGKLLYYVCTPCNYIHLLSLRRTQMHHSNIRAEGVYIMQTSLEWKDMTISFQMTVFIIWLSSPHHLYLHHLTTIPGSHIRTFEINTHVCTHECILVLALIQKKRMSSRYTHAKNRNIHTMPPSCHRAKPSACPTLPLRMFWTSTVMWFPQRCGFVCLCVLFVPWWVGRIEPEEGHAIGLSLIP